MVRTPWGVSKMGATMCIPTVCSVTLWPPLLECKPLTVFEVEKALPTNLAAVLRKVSGRKPNL